MEADMGNANPLSGLIFVVILLVGLGFAYLDYSPYSYAGSAAIAIGASGCDVDAGAGGARAVELPPHGLLLKSQTPHSF
jgi:hypothetical protein